MTLGPAMIELEAPGFEIGSDDRGLGTGTIEFSAPGFVVGAIPDPFATSVGLRTAVADPSGNIIAWLPRRGGVTGMKEANMPGSGTVDIDKFTDIAAEHPGLWDAGNIVGTYLGENLIYEWVIEQWNLTFDDDGGNSVQRSGQGRLAVLNNAILYPEAELTRDSRVDRYFNFASAKGTWYIEKEWKRPSGTSIRKSFRWKLPVGWPKTRKKGKGGKRRRQDMWLWSSSPEKRSGAGPRYFRAEIKLERDTRIKFWAVGDHSMILYVDGTPMFRQKGGGWKKAKTDTRTLGEGTHTIAAMVDTETVEGETNKNKNRDKRSGFLFHAAEVNKKGKVEQVLLRSRPRNWKVRKPLNGPPGWFPANVLQQFVKEAKARGVSGFDTITFDFTDLKDSSGRRWTKRISQSYRVGTRGLDLLQQLTDRGLDVEMGPNGVLSAWVTRGRDRSGKVSLDNYASNSGSASTSMLTTRAITRFRGGWTEVSRTGPRVETALSGGATDSRGDAREQARTSLRQRGNIHATYEIVTTSAKGPQPFIDYNLFDIVTIPLREGERGRGKVMSISWEEGEDDLVYWTHEVVAL